LTIILFSLGRNLAIKLQNRLGYIDGADLIANEAIEQVILNGRMRSYGLSNAEKRMKVD
jgi:hypothetical protein